MKRAIAGLAVGVALLATPAFADRASTSVEQGYDLGEVQHPRGVAVAGAQEAFGGSTSAVFLNPANLALYKVYHLEAVGAFSPEAHRQSIGAAIIDSTRAVVGGFGGTYNVMDPDGLHRSWTDLRLALAYPFGDRFSIGITGRYLRVDQRISEGPFGPSLVSDGTPDDPLFQRFTFDAGAALSITENLRLAIHGRNLTATGTGLAPLILGGGAGYSNGTFTLEGDTLVDFSTYSVARARYMLGAEALLDNRFPVRLGYRFDDGTRTHSVGVGAGYVAKQFSIELGGRRDVAGDNPATILSLGLRLFIETNNGSQAEQADGF